MRAAVRENPGGWPDQGEAGDSLSGKVSPQAGGIQGLVGMGALLGYSSMGVQ